MTSNELAGKVVIVTGGGRGLGRVMTLALARAGASVIAAMHIEQDLRPIEEESRRLGCPGHVSSIFADVRREQDCAQVVGEALTRHGALHAVINNAGLGMRLVSDNFVRERVPFWNVDPDIWRSIIDTNVNGPFLMARAAIPHMIKQGWGRVVNMTTGIHTMQRDGYTPYGPSKAALEAASRAWADDLRGTGVSVNVLLPGGPVDTDMLPGVVGDEQRYDGTVLKPDVIASPVVWLVSDASNGVTGRRFIARDWDMSLPLQQASAKASGPAGFQSRTS